MTTMQRGFVHSAEQVEKRCGLPIPEWMPAPPPVKNDMVIIPYAQWDVEMLRTCLAGAQYIAPFQMDETELTSLLHQKSGSLDIGYYGIDISAHGGEVMHRSEKLDRWELKPHEQWTVAPTPVILSAVLIHLALTGTDLLGDWPCCCGVQTPYGSHPVLSAKGGIMRIGHHWGVEDQFQFLWPLCMKIS